MEVRKRELGVKVKGMGGRELRVEGSGRRRLMGKGCVKIMSSESEREGTLLDMHESTSTLFCWKDD